MSYSQKLADAVKASEFAKDLNPLDQHRFALQWLLRELDRLEARVAQLEGDEK